jgi:hypothetical protein
MTLDDGFPLCGVVAWLFAAEADREQGRAGSLYPDGVPRPCQNQDGNQRYRAVADLTY